MLSLATGLPDLIHHAGLEVKENSPEEKWQNKFKKQKEILHNSESFHLGTCLPAPVSEKKVEKLSSATAALSEGRVPSG